MPTSALMLLSLGLLLSTGQGCQVPERFAGGVDSARPDEVAEAASIIAFASPGRVEGLTEVVELGVGSEGIVAEVLVNEGDQVDEGDLLVRLRSEIVAADCAAARARVESARQKLVRLLRGSREEERRQAEALVTEAEAVLEQARRHHERVKDIGTEGEFVSEEAIEVARRDEHVAEASLMAARHRRDLVKAEPLPEEVAQFEAEILAAEADAEVCEALLRDHEVRAPFAGTILRRLVEPGELISRALPRPVATIADLSKFRVRAEVDERNVGQVVVGQQVTVTADALGDKRLTGRVASILQIMGRQEVRTGDPAEKSDRDVLEVLINLDSSEQTLVVGLRVTVLFVQP